MSGVNFRYNQLGFVSARAYVGEQLWQTALER